MHIALRSKKREKVILRKQYTGESNFTQAVYCKTIKKADINHSFFVQNLIQIKEYKNIIPLNKFNNCQKPCDIVKLT